MCSDSKCVCIERVHKLVYMKWILVHFLVLAKGKEKELVIPAFG